jgi:hypothetical protein
MEIPLIYLQGRVGIHCAACNILMNDGDVNLQRRLQILHDKETYPSPIVCGDILSREGRFAATLDKLKHVQEIAKT